MRQDVRKIERNNEFKEKVFSPNRNTREGHVLNFAESMLNELYENILLIERKASNKEIDIEKELSFFKTHYCILDGFFKRVLEFETLNNKNSVNSWPKWVDEIKEISEKEARKIEKEFKEKSEDSIDALIRKQKEAEEKFGLK